MRRGELIINLVFYSGFPLIVFVIALNIAVVFLTKASLEYELITLFCCVAGLGLFLKSKISVYKQGRFHSFGSAGMSKLNRFCYRAGYAIMAIALFLSFVLYIFFRARS